MICCLNIHFINLFYVQLTETVAQKLEHYFSSDQNKDKLKVVTLQGLNLALKNTVENENKHAFPVVVE